MSKKDAVRIRGKVIAAVGNGAFQIQMEGKGIDDLLHCTLAGKMRKFSIYVIVGDYVDIELSPYDLERGRISFRHKKKPEDYKDE